MVRQDVFKLGSFLFTASTRQRGLPSLYRISSTLFTRRFLVSHSVVEISPDTHGTSPLTNLATPELDHRIIQQLRKANWTIPTPIQAHTIPLLLSSFDVMASSQTGSGKTLMFSIPLVNHLLSINCGGTGAKKKPPQALIIAPTRELAKQIGTVLQTLTQATPLQTAVLVGGENVSRQRAQIGQSHIVVGTPGRILQFVDERTLFLRPSRVVVDEADRCLDLGFEDQLRRIARAMKNHDHHAILCSATFPKAVQVVAAEFLKPSYYFVAAGRVGETNDNIEQHLLWINNEDRQKRQNVALQQMQHHFQSVSNPKSQRVLVFTNTKDRADEVGSMLKNSLHKVSVDIVHGDKSQEHRNRILHRFRNGNLNVLVATDVAARGLDVDDIGLVLQVDMPRDADTYTHRIGRTGRAGKNGKAVAIVDSRSVGLAPTLVENLYRSKQSIPSWLWGMAHVATAKRLQEEDAILAGSGGASERSSIADESTLTDSEYGSQDFRSSAQAGSWGSERDTSFREFDDAAYSDSLIESVDDVQEDTILSHTTAQEGTPQEDKVELKNISEAIHSRGTISKSLKSLLGEAKCQDLGEEPSKKVISELGKRGRNSLQWFEYVGLFPFDKVSQHLRTKERSQSSSQINGLPSILMVAEKPSIAKAISEALATGRGPRERRGISRALPVYEFTVNDFRPHPGAEPMKCLVRVTSVVGHVFTLEFDDESSTTKARARDPKDMFHLPVVKAETSSTGKLRVLDHLRALSGQSDHLVLWLDCDAEGENIAHEVIGVTRRAFAAKDSVEGSDDSSRIHRARFSAITKEAIRQSFQHLTTPDQLLSKSVDARQELDLRVGVAFTRLLSWRCVDAARKKFSQATKVVSYGPCQTPTLSFCVNRAREIQQFVPRDYWKVQMHGRSKNQEGVVSLNWVVSEDYSVPSDQRNGPKDNDFIPSATFDVALAEQVVSLASAPGTKAVIVKVEDEEIERSPPVGLNTVALLSAGSKALGLSPKQMMNVAESLYSAGYISYPRTESTKYDPTGFDVKQVVAEHRSHPEWGKTAGYLLATKYKNMRRPPARGINAGDHPPITCLRPATREEVGGGQAWRVYDFVTRSFLGSLSDSLVYTKRRATVQLREANGDDLGHQFHLSQKTVSSLGFAGACPWVLKDIGAQRKDADSPTLTEGMEFIIDQVEQVQCSTRPPAFLQEHQLIELMDTNRIGTDASMATHVSNILDRGYVVLCDETGVPLRPPPRPGQQKRLPRQKGRYLVPTSLGMALINLFEHHDSGSGENDPSRLAEPAIRAKMEREVGEIARGEIEKNDCLRDNLAWFEDRYTEFESLLHTRKTQFANSLQPTKQSLRYWKKLGAFDEESSPKQQEGARNPKKHSSKRPPPQQPRTTATTTKKRRLKQQKQRMGGSRTTVRR